MGFEFAAEFPLLSRFFVNNLLDDLPFNLLVTGWAVLFIAGDEVTEGIANGGQCTDL